MTVTDAAIPRLIELARWAPSGDNTQPWRFQVLAPDHLVIQGFDTRDHCVYDLDGHPSQMALGALIETLHIAASEQSMSLGISRRLDSTEERPIFDVRLARAEGLPVDPLLPTIPRRSVNRCTYSTKPLSPAEAERLAASLPTGYTLRLYASTGQRWRMARLMFANAKLRLTTQEAYEVHRSIIDWSSRFSADKVPDQALGLDAATLKLMRWALADWRRVSFLNRWLAGTVAPRLQMDLLPSMMCAGHLAVVAETAPTSLDDYVAAGRAVQRLWLTATLLGLQHQPEMTPLIFSRYVREGRPFSRSPAALGLGTRLARLTEASLGLDPSQVVWLGRIGVGRSPLSRSLRLGCAALLAPPPQRHGAIAPGNPRPEDSVVRQSGLKRP